MPQPWRIQTPCFAKARISASGTAAPPTSERMPRGSFQRPGCSASARVVGLDQRPARSSARRARASAARPASGRAGRRDAGAGRGRRASRRASPRAYGMPQQLAWNIGVTGSTSRCAQAPAVAEAADAACAARSSGANRRRPSAGPSCPTCSTSRPDRSRRAPRTRSRRGRPGEQRLVVVEVRLATGAPENGNDDHALERCTCRELPVQRQQHVVDDQEAVLGVVGDPADLVGREAQVQRVHHAAGGRDAEVALEVRVVVPAQRRDALALAAGRARCSAEASARVRRWYSA